MNLNFRCPDEDRCMSRLCSSVFSVALSKDITAMTAPLSVSMLISEAISS